MRRFLFDRLFEPLQQEPLDEYSQLDNLRASIKEELQRLLSGRAYFTGIQKGTSDDKSILNFGIDHPVDYGNSFRDSTQLMEQILEQIRKFEPRLRSPAAQLETTRNTLVPASVLVTGHIQVANIKQPFSHQFSFNGDD